MDRLTIESYLLQVNLLTKGVGENMDIQKARQILNIFQDGFLGDDLLKLSDACDDLKSFINKQAETIESLKNCCNCDRSYLGVCDDSEIDIDCENNKYKHWQPIK